MCAFVEFVLSRIQCIEPGNHTQSYKQRFRFGNEALHSVLGIRWWFFSQGPAAECNYAARVQNRKRGFGNNLFKLLVDHVIDKGEIEPV